MLLAIHVKQNNFTWGGAFIGKTHALIISCLTKQFKLRLQRLLQGLCLFGAYIGKVSWCLQRHKIYIFVVPLTAKFGGAFSGIKPIYLWCL